MATSDSSGEDDPTIAQYQQLMNLLSKSSGPGGASSETTLTRANLTHSNPNQIHNSDFGSHFVFSIPTTHTPNNLSSHTVPWIIDSEAIDYISCSLDCFYTYFTIAPIKIHLPNEFTVQAHILGSIKFTPDFIIHNVLFVPDFSFNLLSIILWVCVYMTMIFEEKYDYLYFFI